MTGADVGAYSCGVQTPASDGLAARFPLRPPPGVPRHFGILAIPGSIVQCIRLTVEIPTDADLKQIRLFTGLSVVKD